jgi:hypothetical protein
MDEEAARKLEPETVVMWNGDPNDTGTIHSIDRYGVSIKWENGLEGWIAFQDLGAVTVKK